jgi:hypothetical protein
MLRRHRLDAIEREGELEVDRLFGPQRPVIVEGRDTLRDGNEVGAAVGGDARDEIGDGFLYRTLVPRGQRIALRQGSDAG